jgi:hypothetical protein
MLQLAEAGLPATLENLGATCDLPLPIGPERNTRPDMTPEFGPKNAERHGPQRGTVPFGQIGPNLTSGTRSVPVRD